MSFHRTQDAARDPMTLRPDIADWLGDIAGDLDAAQADRLTALFDTITARWPDTDDTTVRVAALSGATQVVLGDDTLDAIADTHLQARITERETMAALHGAVLASATGARSPRPGSEADLIERSRLSRMTIRKILGRS